MTARAGALEMAERTTVFLHVAFRLERAFLSRDRSLTVLPPGDRLIVGRLGLRRATPPAPFG